MATATTPPTRPATSPTCSAGACWARGRATTSAHGCPGGASTPSPTSPLPNGVADGPLDLLADAAAAAVGVEALVGQSRDVVRARTAACHVADATTRELADALQVRSRTIERARSRTPDPELVEAVRRQLYLRDALRAREPDPRTTAPSDTHEPDWASPPEDDRPWP